MQILKKERTVRKLSQESVASFLGITQQAYANYERGARKPDPDTLVKLADLFNVSVDYLLGRDEQKKEAPSPIPLMEKDASKIAKIYAALSDENKEKAMQYMTSLKALDEYTKEVEHVGSYAAYGGEHGTKILVPSSADQQLKDENNQTDNKV